MIDNTREIETTTLNVCSVGAVVSGIISWATWHSVSWLILHSSLGWIYVIYYYFKYGFGSL